MAKGLFGKNSNDSSKYIEDVEDLNAIRYLPKDKSDTFYLSHDINMNVYPYNEKEGWEPLPVLRGNFYGNNCTIFNMYINRPKEDNVGLFRKTYTEKNEVLKVSNLFFDNVNISGRNNVGTIIGTSESQYLEINDIIVSGKISGNNKVAGIVGYSHGQSTYCTEIENVFLNMTIESNKGNVDAITTDGYQFALRNSLCLVKIKLYEDSQVEANSYSASSVIYNENYIKNISYKGSRPSTRSNETIMSGAMDLPCTGLKNYISIYRGELPKYDKYNNIKYSIKIENDYCTWDASNNTWKKIFGEDATESQLMSLGYSKKSFEAIPKEAFKKLKGKAVSIIAVAPQLNGFKTVNITKNIVFDEQFNTENHQENKLVLKKTFLYSDFNNEICSVSTL